MPERSWKRALKGQELFEARVNNRPKDSEGNEMRMPFAQLRTTVRTGFTVELGGTVTRVLDRTYGIERYKSSDREAVEAFGGEWREPSELFDLIVAEFKMELELAMSDAMPWDGEY